MGAIPIPGIGYLRPSTPSTFLFMAGPDCTDWNSSTFFEEASSDDVGRCLSEGADPNARDTLLWEKTPLHYAAIHSKTPEVVKALLDAGADLNARDENRRTPLHLAAGFNKTPEVVKVLLDADANPKARDKNRWTPLHSAVWYSKTPAVVQLLLDAGADPKARTNNGKTALDLISDDSPLKGTNVYWQLNNARFA